MNTKNILDEKIKLAQQHFNRREYVQYILPIIQLIEKNTNKVNNLSIRDIFNNYLINVFNSVDQDKEILSTGEEVISLSKIKEILDREKSLII